MKTLKLIALAGLALISLTATGQARKGVLHINEVMTINESNFVDDFGGRPAWIELYNSKFAPLEISSVYITTDSATSPDTWYAVPLHDVNTKLPKRQHVVFWADGMPSRGTFHTNFVLATDKPNEIYLFDSDKKTLIDHVTVPVLAPNTTYARAKDGITVYDKNGNVDVAATWEVRNDIDEGKYITPSSNNVIEDRNDKVEKFADKDPNGFGMAGMAMCIVFSALAVLCIAFMIINKIGGAITKSNKMRSHGIDVKETPREEHPDHDSGEEITAIVMALHEHLNAHDNESHVLTINKVKRAYSPWSSKIYNMRQLPHR
ncbi:MAG: OadG family protein [Muribaculaceae bacterium]|nr:OadG family protein [Muribaculaceae bacterium]